MESDMNVFLDEDTFRTSSEHDATITPDSHFFSFRNIQFRSDSQGTPQKFPAAPHPSPVLSPDPSVVSRVSDRFESELLKACNTFCDQTKLLEGIAHDRATASSSTSPEKLLELTPEESECMSTFYNTKYPLDIRDILEPVSSSSSPMKRKSDTSSVGSDTDDYSQQFLLQCRSPKRLASSMSNISLITCPSSSFNEKTSDFFHCASEISDLSATESEMLLSSEYTLNPVNEIECGECCGNDLSEENSDKGSDKEIYDKVNIEFPINSWKVYSPRRPRSSVGEFLNWRKNKALRRKRGTSVGNVYTPPIRRNRDSSDSKFLMTI